MPPNALQIWDLSAAKRQLHDIPVHVDHYDDRCDDGVHDHHEAELDACFFLSPKEQHPQPIKEQDDQSLWKKLLNCDIDTVHTSIDSELHASLSSIIVLDNKEREQDWLHQFRGRLSSVSVELLEGLR